MITTIGSIVFMKLGDYIRQQRQKLKLDQEDLAELLGVSQRTISKWERNLSRPTYDKFPQIIKALNMDPFEAIKIAYNVDLRDYIDKEYQFFVDQHVLIPLLNVYAANDISGYEVFVPEQIIDKFPFKRSWLESKLKTRLTDDRLQRLILIKTRGDSMEPTISDGEVVLIDKFRPFVEPITIESKHIYVIRWGTTEQGLSVKRLTFDPDEKVLVAHSDNPLWQPKRISLTQPLGYYVLGKVIWVGKENI